jgi:hypothetical protein
LTPTNCQKCVTLSLSKGDARTVVKEKEERLSPLPSIISRYRAYQIVTR